MAETKVNLEDSSGTGVIRFGIFEVDLNSGELRRKGLLVRLQDKPFQILATLLLRAGEPVTREELRQRLWDSDTHVDFDRSLNIAVAKLRATLGDDPENPHYIETLPRRGYRFIGQIGSDAARGIYGSSPVQTETSTWRAARIPLAGGLVVLVGVLFLAWELRPPQEPRVLDITQITNDGFPKTPVSAMEGSVGTAINGSTLYFCEVRDGGPTLVRMSTSGGAVEPLHTPLRDPVVEDFSAARSELLAIDLVGRDGGPLWALKMPEGDARQVGSIVAGAAAWSPDGGTIAYASADGIYLSDVEGGHVRLLTRVPGTGVDLAWSPDGKVLRFTLRGIGDRQSIWQLGSDGKGLHPLFHGWRESGGQKHGKWTADGKYFIFQSFNEGRWDLWALQEKAGWLGREMDNPILLVRGLSQETAPIPSPGGQNIFVIGVQARSEVVHYDPRHSRFVPLLGRISAQQLDYSRDGQWLAYVSYPGDELWRSRTDGTDQMQLSADDLIARVPQWSPDGKWIAFMAEGRFRGDSWQIYLIPSSGGGLRPLPYPRVEEGFPTWSPDGKFLAFGELYRPGVRRASRLRIHLYSLASGQLSTVPGSQGLWTARWSPRGDYIAALTTDNRTLMLFNIASGKWSPLATTNPIADMVWSRSGDALYFVDYYLQRGIFRISLKSRRIEEVGSLAGFRSGPSARLVIAPDNSLLLIRDAGSQEIYALHCDLP